MKNRPWWTTFKRFLGIFVLSFVLYALVDLLYLSLLPLSLGPELAAKPIRRAQEPGPDIRQDVNRWRETLLEQPPLTRTITISATLTEITLDLDLWLTDTHVLVARAAYGELDAATLPFAQAAFGEIYVEHEELTSEAYSDPIWTLDPDLQLAHIHVQAAAETDGTSYVRVQHPVTSPVTSTHDILVVEFSDLHLRYLDPVPDRVTQNSTYMERTTPGTINYLSYRFEPLTEFRESSAPSERRVREDRQRFLQRLGDVIDIPFISRMLYGIVRVFPLILFLYLVASSTEKPSLVIVLSGMVVNLLLFHFTVYFLSASEQIWSDDFPFIARLSESMMDAISPYLRITVRPLLGLGVSRVLAAVLGILLPALLLQRSQSFSWQTDRWKERFIRFLVAMVLVSGMVIPIAYVLLSQGRVVLSMDAEMDFASVVEFLLYWKQLLVEGDVLAIPLWSVTLFTSSLLSFLIWRILIRLYRRVALKNSPPGVTLLTTLLITLMATFTGYARGISGSWQTWEPWGWLVLSTTLGFVALFSLAKVVYPLVQQALPNLSLPLWGRRSLVVLAIVLSIPMAKFVDSSRSIAGYATIATLVYRLVEWPILIWAAGILYFLHQKGQDGLKVEALARALGILGISCYLFNTSARWFYIPVTFLIGWLTLKQWFVGSPSDLRTPKDHFENVVQKRAQWLDQILDVRVAEKAYREFRKKSGEKLAEGALTFSKYDHQLELQRRQLNSLRARATTKDEQPVKELALAFGPYPTAWQNGVHGAKFALLFSLPWIVLYLKDFLSDPTPLQTYPLWGFGASLLTVVLRWTTYGFFLGYFYPYLRGKTGLQKGLGLFFVSVAPALPLMALSNSSATAWQASLFWALQVFIHCMLLGLAAFDYVILRQEGYEWQMLFEIHGLPSLGVSVSSILVAVGAAVTTLLTGQTTELVKAALTFVIPQVPPDILPK